MHSAIPKELMISQLKISGFIRLIFAMLFLRLFYPVFLCLFPVFELYKHDIDFLGVDQ